MELSKSSKIFGTIEIIAAVAIIITAVVFSPNLYTKPPKETTTVTAKETTENANDDYIEVMGEENEEESLPPTIAETTAPTTIEQTNIGEYSVSGYIVVTKNSAMEMYSISKEKLAEYTQTINTLSEKVPNANVFMMLAPTRMEFYGPEEYKTGSHSQKRGIEFAYSTASPKVKCVDAYSELSKKTNDYIYFRTDHHWTARGAFCAYSEFCKSAGLSYAPLESYQTGQLDGFVGSMYRYTGSEDLKNNPDYVEYFMPIFESSAQYFTSAAMTDPKPLRIISTNITDPASKYLTFIQGDKPLIKMVSSSPRKEKVLLIKESYGNAFAPFLLENFSEVYVLDPRQEGVRDMNLVQFINDNQIGNVICLNYTMAPSNGTYMSAFKNIVNK
ncbi:MAG: DHHW family protein [Oscillospiraceae bacterium]